MIKGIICLALLCLSATSSASDFFFTQKSDAGFEETLLRAQESIQDRGFNVIHVQRVDEGLQKSGYYSDNYKIIFFDKPEHTRDLLIRSSEAAMLLPFSIVVYDLNGDVYISSADISKLNLSSEFNDIGADLTYWATEIREIIASSSKH